MPLRLHRPLTYALHGLLASCLVFGLHGAPAHVRADDQTPAGERPKAKGNAVMGEVLVLLATGEDGSVDPSLSKVRALKHPPFNEYKTIKLLSKSTVPLPLDQSVEIDLPKHRKLVLKLVSRLADGRAKIQLSIRKANQKDYLPLLDVIASSEEWFFVAGQKFEGGTLVIGMRAGERLRDML